MSTRLIDCANSCGIDGLNILVCSMTGYDYDRTLVYLQEQGHIFPDKGYIVTGRQYKYKTMLEADLIRRGFEKYDLLIDPSNKFGISKDQKAIFKARCILLREIDEFYDDDPYQIRVIFAFLRNRKYECKLFHVLQKDIKQFQI